MALSLRLYTEPCRSNARVPGGRICSSVLDISFHRIKALAAISSPSSAKLQCTDPRDMIGGGEEGSEKRERGRERQTDKQKREREGWVKDAGKEGEGLRDREMRARLRACRAGKDGSG